MASVLFIGEEELKRITVIGLNVDVNMLTPNIAYAQDYYLQSIYGSKLYLTVENAYSANTLNSYQTELVNLSKPALAYRTVLCALPFLNMQIRNKGINKLNSDNSVQAELADLKYLIQEIKQRCEFYEQRVVDYLVLNGSNFPDYVSPNYQLPPLQNSMVDCPIFLGGSYSSNAYCYKCGTYNCNCGNC